MKTIRATLIYAPAKILLAVALLAMTALMSASALASPNAQTADEIKRLKGLSGQDFETEFLNMMIPHHQDAIDMAKLAPDRANHEQVKTLAQSIIATQSDEITQMTAWLKQWYNAAPKQDMMQHEDMAMGKLQSLKGDDFDKEFLTMMRTHHQSALAMAALAADRATHSELRTLAQNIDIGQLAEIRDMDNWLKSWYNLDAAGSPASGGSMSGDAMQGESKMDAGQSNLPATGSPSTIGGGSALAAVALLCLATLTTGLWLRKRATKAPSTRKEERSWVG